MTEAPAVRHNSTVPAGYAPLMLRRGLHPMLAGQVYDIVGYRENGAPLAGSLEMATLVVPLIISFGEPFEIALGRAPDPDERFGSFTAGLYPGFVLINSTGRSECVQIDFTPLGACRFFGMPMRELAGRMVTLDDLGNDDIRELRQRLGEETDWDRRFDIVETFVLGRLRNGPPACAAVAWAYREIVRGHGATRVSHIARSLGWSRKHLNDRFSDEIGVGPKAMARMVRFNHAVDLSRANPAARWADIAADCGYSDQAHLVREFREFAGTTPTELSPVFRPNASA